MKKVLQPPTEAQKAINFIRTKNAMLDGQIVGHCMFTGEPILASDFKKDPLDFGYTFQTVVISVPGTSDRIIKHGKVYMYKRKAITELPYRAEVIKALERIDINYLEIQDSYMNFKKKEAIENKHKAALAVELGKMDEPVDETKGKTKKANGKN